MHRATKLIVFTSLLLSISLKGTAHGIERHTADMKRIFPFVGNNTRNKDIIDFYYTVNAFIDYRSFPSNERKVGRPLCIAEHPKFGKMKFANHRIWFHWGFNKDPKKFDPLARLVDQNIERGVIRESDRAEFWQVLMQEVSKRNRYLMNEWSKILGYEGLGNMSAAMRAQSNAFVTMLYSIHLIGDHQTKLTDIMLNINSVYGDVYNAIDNLAGRSRDNRNKANRLKTVLRRAQDDPGKFLDVLEQEFTPFLYSLEGGIYDYKKRFEGLGYILK